MNELELLFPDFLKETADDIHKRMLKKAPKDIATTEGDFFWDMTRPTAEEEAKLIQMQLQNVLKMAFPQSSYGEYLEYLGECKGIFKNQPTKAIGNLRVVGKPGTIIEKGKIVATPATDNVGSIEFEITESSTIDNSERALVKIECKESGAKGNVKKGSITILITPINGVKSISNEEDFKGGTDIEDEDHYRERVITAEHEDRLSGAESDYIRWAKEVDGVGYAYIISEWNGPGTVKILILDKNGESATKHLIESVQNYICPLFKKDGNRGGKAPVGALVSIATPDTLRISVKAKFIFKEEFDSELILESIKNRINKYLSGIDIGGTIIYNAIHTIIGSMILTCEGITDFKELTINNIAENITLKDQVAVIGEVINI